MLPPVPPPSSAATPAPSLSRSLGLWQCVGLVVGTIIGTGVFFKTATMANHVGSVHWVLLAWAVAGALSLAGALTYAELGAMYPEAGGEYVYLREAHGRYAGYLYGWTRFWVGSPGSIAAYAVGSASLLAGVLPVDELGGRKLFAVALIALFSIINCLRVRIGGNLQVVLTALKVALILGLAVAAFTAPSSSWGNLSSAPGSAFPGISAFGLAIISALWAYDGWNNLPMAAGEVASPQKNLPRALILGALSVLAIYALINLAYFYALPFSEVLTSNSDAHKDAPAVAEKVGRAALGDIAGSLLAFAMTISALSAMSGAILTGSRVPFALARDRLAPPALARLNGAAVPATAVLVQGTCASLLALSGSFDQLTNSVVFASWIFYAMNAGSVLLLRRRRPDQERPYRVPGFPVVPIIFIAVSGLLLVNTVLASPRDSGLGLGLMALSLPFYFLTLRLQRRHDAR
jgi:basic amino acid/polyamine antiporter, APA family